ncbi:GtrA family protein [Phreatobacter oligotrophus]|uniref:Putative flippase GtrA n=1 Tax=Phreatobacter oligotrophus TaxID=1122261 RepID=A0A2T4Z0W3_9HYPH|nr:GtrA family protein [Phreatobacter oligotrophus]PTM53363.1 putative flippase GtrA [Phreatobacter oligotrophus]
MRGLVGDLARSPFLRFLASGGIAAGVNILARILFSQVMAYEIAVVVAYLAGMLTAYVLMRLFVFEASGRGAGSELWRFAIVNAVALVQVWLVSVGLARWLFPAVGYTFHADTVAHVIGVLSPVLTSYWLHSGFTFGTGRG